jgi:two-component system, OmpR family, alkaline phosphatase synthesis response regulator PhoP
MYEPGTFRLYIVPTGLINNMKENNFTILLVDDEEDILEFVSYNLRKEGFNVFTARNGREALELAVSTKPHLILLDIMMPEMDGIETCEIIRSTPSIANTVLAFLTARAEDYSQIAGFNAGADDYIAKPIRPKVLISRIHALLKRNGKNETDVREIVQANMGIEIDKESHTVRVDGIQIELPKKEFNLLLLLTSKPSRVFTREEIFDYIWGPDVLVGDRTIDVYIRKIREKIGENKIKTIKGVGYKYDG